MFIRKLRHWKQQYNANAKFIWQRPTTYAGKWYKPGSDVPKELYENKNKLRRFWESQRISLAEFEAPNVATGIVTPKKAVKKPAKKRTRKAKPVQADNFDDILS